MIPDELAKARELYAVQLIVHQLAYSAHHIGTCTEAEVAATWRREHQQPTSKPMAVLLAELVRRKYLMTVGGRATVYAPVTSRFYETTGVGEELPPLRIERNPAQVKALVVTWLAAEIESQGSQDQGFTQFGVGVGWPQISRMLERAGIAGLHPTQRPLLKRTFDELERQGIWQRENSDHYDMRTYWKVNPALLKLPTTQRVTKMLQALATH